MISMYISRMYTFDEGSVGVQLKAVHLHLSVIITAIPAPSPLKERAV
jgi:hypothetical protein